MGAPTLEFVAGEVEAAERVRSELESLGATLEAQLAAVHADATRTPEYRAQAERELRDAAQTQAAALLKERDATGRLDFVARAEPYWSRGAILRRLPLTDGKDATREALERLTWRLELPQFSVDELEELFSEAEANGSLTLQRLALRELQQRTSGADAAAALPVARRVGERFARAELPAEVARAADVFGRLQRVRREIENSFSGLGRPVGPIAKLQAARAGGGR